MPTDIKRLLVVVFFVALSFVAQADLGVIYSWALNVTDVKFNKTLPTDIVCYLVDRNVSGSSQEKFGGAVMAKLELDRVVDSGDSAKTVLYKATAYNYLGYSAWESSTFYNVALNADGEGDVFAQVGTVTGTKAGIDWVDMGKTADEVNAYAKENLYAVIYSESAGKQLNLPVSANYAITSLGSTASFKNIIPVPEPTGGFLLLMGLAGLMLKRKKAA